jgi:hypothetical protein
LTHFIKSTSQTKWSTDSQLSEILETFNGDVVHAMQAIKEIAMFLSAETNNNLYMRKAFENLLDAVIESRAFCATMDLKYPFDRSERQIRDTMSFFWPEHIIPISKPLNDLGKSPSFPNLASSNLEYFQLGTSKQPRIFTGLWQVSSAAWGSGSMSKQQEALIRLKDAGLVAADMADHYVGEPGVSRMHT